MTDPQRPAARPRAGLFLESRYRKLVRGLPQTIFYCPDCKGDRHRRRRCARCAGRGKLCDDSVQELIGRVLLPAFRARTGKFHGAGREDVDVRMLGRGRPFVYELCGVRRLEADLEDLLARVHRLAAGRVEFEPFRRVERDRVRFWKEARFDKIYAAEVELAGEPAVAALQELVERELEIAQRTPQRVAHRRADRERVRRVRVLSVARGAADRLRVQLRCSHGTYVKEWISGEEGRTSPGLPDLIGVPARCAALDVLEICD